MKFAKELDQDAVPEWRAKYLDYKAGKKHVKAVSRAISRALGTPTFTPTLARRTEAAQQPCTTPAAFFGLAHAFTPPRQANDPAAGTGEGPDPLQPGARTAKEPRSAAPGDERSGLTRSPGSGMQYGSFGAPSSRASDKIDFELPAPAIRIPSRTSEHLAPPSPHWNRRAVRDNPTTASDVLSPVSVNLPASGSASTPRPRMRRLFSLGSTPNRQTPNKLEISMQNLDYVRAAKREFFAFLDSELDKIETFYKEKEDQATERLAALRAQLHEMRNRRTAEIAEVKAKREVGRNDSRSGDDSGEHAQEDSRDWISPIRDRFMKPGPNSEALQRMTRTPLMAGQTLDGGRDYVRRPTSDDVPYRTAKRKLKLALQEFYRSLELLKSYALLNRTAFRKLNKKYDKAVNARPPYRYMNDKVNKSWFVNSDILDGHIRTVEDLYARYFERGNRKIAAGKLRNLQKRPGDSSDSAFRSGLLIGLGAVFAVQGLINAADVIFGEDSDLAEPAIYLMQLYGGYFLVLLLFALFTLDCRMWTKNRVNYPFIFELDSRNFLDWKQLAEFPSFFFALFGAFLWLNFSGIGNWESMYLHYPVLLICITLAILFFPAPVLQHRARRWFLYSHYRLLLSGFYPVEFRDFFLGDIWCSLTYATCNVELFFCLYATYWSDPEECSSSKSRLLGFLGALPPIWRALQCLRRYRDTKNVFPHLVNCGKYTMTILTAVCLSLYRIEDGPTNMSLFIAFATINAVYCSIWDLFMDFSLLQANARRRFLRDITALRPVWVYYLIMVVDPILRFSWIFYAIFTHHTELSTIVSFMVSLAEVVRRGLWTLLRVENEHCANVAQYKAARDTPLPYALEVFYERPSLEAAAAAATDTGNSNTAAAAASSTAATAAVGRTPDLAVITPTPPGSRPASGTTVQRPPTQHPGSGSLRIHPMPTPRSERSYPAAAAAAAAAATTAMGSGSATAMEEGAVGVGVGVGGGSVGMGPFRLRRSDTLGKRSIRQAMAEAHKQDFEKRRRPVDSGGEGMAGAGARGGGEGRAGLDADEEEEEVLRSDEDEEEDEDDDEDEEGGLGSLRLQEERMRAREAETLMQGGKGEDD